MKNLTKKYAWLSILALGLIALGCGDVDQENGENQVGEDSAAVQGQLRPDSPQGEEAPDYDNKMVTALEVGVDGELTVVAREDAEVSGDGSFRVYIDLDVYQGRELVIEAYERESQESAGRVLVEGSASSAATLKTAPISAETSVEVDVYLEARRSGEWDEERCSTAQLRAMIDEEVAAAMKASADYQSEVEAMARATMSAMKASYDYLLEVEGKSRAELEALASARSEARAEADAALLAGAEAQDGFELYMEALIAAQADLSVEAEAQARAAHAMAESFLLASEELSQEVQAEARARVEAKRSYLVSAAVEAKLELLAAMEAGGEALDRAVQDLRSELDASLSAQARAEIWMQFESSVEAELSEAQRAFWDAIDISEAMDAYVSARAQISAEAESTLIAESSVSAMAELWAQAEARADAALDELQQALETLSEVEARALVSLMLHIQLAASADG